MRHRLLLADDSVTIQRVIELTFADENVEVIAVGDGDAAIVRLDADPPDIVLADVGMPGRDGYDVALHVSRTPALAHIPVVLLIGALQPLDDRRAKDAGCAGVLVKPFEPNLVIAKVRELLSRAPKPAAAAGAPASTPSGDAAAAAPTPSLESFRSEETRRAESPVARPNQTVPPGAELLPGSPADAVLASPLSAAEASSGVDDYFARLDAAFAAFDATAPAATPPDAPAAEPPATVPLEPPSAAVNPDPPSEAEPTAPQTTHGRPHAANACGGDRRGREPVSDRRGCRSRERRTRAPASRAGRCVCRAAGP